MCSERGYVSTLWFECIDLVFNVIKISVVYYSYYYPYDKNLENQENFINLVSKIEKTFKALENAKLIFCL